MSAKLSGFLRTVLVVILILCIPLSFVLAGIQIHSYANLNREVKALNEKQYKLIDENRRLVSEISVLTGSERIEKIAQEEYGMRPAESSEILRVNIVGN